jgi:peptidoglycan/xylan/chitin deacetylase (PgdA/CDA1 family)
MRSDRTALHTPDGTLPLRNLGERLASLRAIQHRVKQMPHDEAEALVVSICEKLDAAPIEKKTVLSWDELRELSQNGIAVAAHSRTHAILTRVPLPKVHDEARGAREDLRRELGDVLPVFCYPNGSHDDGVVAVVREEGFRLAFTVEDGENDLATDDPMRLRRTNITPRTSGAIFRLRMTRWGTRFDSWRHRIKG